MDEASERQDNGSCSVVGGSPETRRGAANGKEESEMTGEPSESRVSAESCPVCGEHRVAVLPLPETAVLGVQPYTDLLMMGDRPAPFRAAIGCLACGSEWPDLDSFRAASRQEG